MSTSRDITNTSGDIMSTSGDFISTDFISTSGGYNDVCERGDVQYIRVFNIN